MATCLVELGYRLRVKQLVFSRPQSVLAHLAKVAPINPAAKNRKTKPKQSGSKEKATMERSASMVQDRTNMS